jgi:hypothetical protein
VIHEEKEDDDKKQSNSASAHQQAALALTPTRKTEGLKQTNLQSKVSPKMPSMRSPEQPPQYFKPMINKKSEILDKKVTSKYQFSQTSRIVEAE